MFVFWAGQGEVCSSRGGEEFSRQKIMYLLKNMGAKRPEYTKKITHEVFQVHCD